MVTIQIDGKTYKNRNGDWDYDFIHQINRWINGWFLEEVETPTDKTVGDPVALIRVEVERLYKYWNTGCEAGKVLWEILTFIDSLSSSRNSNSSECDHVSDWLVYTSSPPKYRCKKCGKFAYHMKSENQFSVNDWPYITLEWKSDVNISWTWVPEPGEMIEVSRDGKKWYKGEFTHIDGKNYPFAISPENEAPFVCWKFARPIQKPVYDFEWTLTNAPQKYNLSF